MSDALHQIMAAAIKGSKHDYEPGDERHPMHTDPMCRICGRPKRDH